MELWLDFVFKMMGQFLQTLNSVAIRFRIGSGDYVNVTFFNLLFAFLCLSIIISVFVKGAKG